LILSSRPKKSSWRVTFEFIISIAAFRTAARNRNIYAMEWSFFRFLIQFVTESTASTTESSFVWSIENMNSGWPNRYLWTLNEITNVTLKLNSKLHLLISILSVSISATALLDKMASFVRGERDK
jgi:hypothetical protein